VLRRFRVGQIVTPPRLLHQDEPALAASRAAIRRAGIPVREVSRGETLVIGRCRTRILHPPPRGVDGSDNANSLVLRIDHGNTTLILPGDVEPPGTERLIEHDRPPPGGILMAPHHGSLQMDAATVLTWARPAVTIVSGGRRAKKPEVRQMLSITGSDVWVTARQGAIRVRIDSVGTKQLRAWIEDPW
jgi:competence protein ComEC